MFHNTKKLSVFGVAALAVALTTACNTQPQHPNQLNAFDGATYDTLTLAHAALTSFRARISADLPQYVPVFNQAAGTYNAAYETYATFRLHPAGQAAASAEIAVLTANIVSLESAFASGMHANPQTVARVRNKAARMRARAGKNVTVSDILTELEIAASVAEAIPAAQPYASIAAVVIDATNQALAAEEAAAGQPIDLTTLQPLQPIQ